MTLHYTWKYDLETDLEEAGVCWSSICSRFSKVAKISFNSLKSYVFYHY